jgi:hypothetical protein
LIGQLALVIGPTIISPGFVGNVVVADGIRFGRIWTDRARD